MKNQSSVTSLLMLGVLSATLIYSCIFCMIVYVQVDRTLMDIQNQSLMDQAYSVANYLDHGGGGLNYTKPNEGTFLASPGAPYQFLVRDASTGAIHMQSPDAFVAGFPKPGPSGGDESYFSFTTPDNVVYIGATQRYRSHGRTYVIQIAQNESSVRSFSEILSRNFLKRISLFGIPFLFLLMLVIALSIKLIMSPLTKAMRQAKEISFANPDIRLNDSIFPQEIQPLARAVNDALDRLSRGIEAQKDFIAHAAHELRTPLSVLRTHVDLLQDKDVAERMRADVDAMARLVSQLLDTARLESSEKPDMAPIDLAKITRAVCETIAPLMIKTGHPFEVHGIEKEVVIKGNEDMISRALRNLLENAIKHTPKGTPVSVELSSAVLIVADKGPGVPVQERGRVFDKFGRGDSRQSDGAGLGLFIVRKIMELHGGRVSVDHDEMKGNRFILDFMPGEEIIS